ncbi:DUF1801 domain-containing protein [Mucilaginibacter mali]|uniref:DUF1801 domain-containing protein n=1 Tax=Mucilaginibacter mali TaxID=2740462 RepID=A0A7D4QCK2_9SPHI|nr:DUF1801 domain-containing protein [Mucilaginibacter mali]QKJ28272.1 DUF1801 domain-containing protein [Mucilaginibacter mali]
MLTYISNLTAMTVPEFISTIPAGRRQLITALHEAIMANDATVAPVIEPMMGVEMIIYKERAYMKYGLASTKKYMSLHCLPMYMNPPLHAKFSALLPLAKFQKGCINFTDTEEMPVDAVAALITDCAGISIAALLEARNRKKK